MLADSSTSAVQPFTAAQDAAAENRATVHDDDVAFELSANVKKSLHAIRYQYDVQIKINTPKINDLPVLSM